VACPPQLHVAEVMASEAGGEDDCGSESLNWRARCLAGSD
jgi:hypothetical protein